MYQILECNQALTLNQLLMTFWNRLISTTALKISEWVDFRNKVNLTKIGVQKWEVPPKRGLPNFKLLNLFSWKHEVFEVSKYKRKIKFGQSLGYQNEGFPLKTGPP